MAPTAKKTKALNPESGSPLRSKGELLAKKVTKSGRVAPSGRRSRKLKNVETLNNAATAEDIATEPKPDRQPQEKRSPQQRMRDEYAVIKQVQLGYKPKEIAERLSLSLAQVYAHLANTERHYMRLSSELVAKSRGEQVAVIDSLLDVCMQGIRESTLPAVKRTIEAMQPVTVTETDPVTGQPVTKQLVARGGRSGKVVEVTEQKKLDVNFVFAANGLLQRKAKALGTDTIPQLVVVWEEREATKKGMIEIAKRHIKDPKVLRAFAEDLMREEESEPEHLALETEAGGEEPPESEERKTA